MALQKSHGKPYPQPARADELPAGVPSPTDNAVEAERLRRGEGSRTLASRGGKARAESRRLAKMLGLAEPAAAFREYAAYAREWRDAQLQRLAESVGGGEVGPGPAAIVSTAARQLAASLAIHDAALAEGCEDTVNLLERASKLGDASRQNLLAAHELCAREAKARPRDPMADLDRRLGITK